MTAAQAEQQSARGATSALPAGRQAGVCLHLTALPGPYGIGELGKHARRFINFMSDAGINVWQFLPNGPTAYGDSPYQPLSSFAGNEMLIDLHALVELGLLQPEETTPLQSLPTAYVEYGKLIPLKHALLRRAASRFADKAPKWLKRDYEEFRDLFDGAWVHDYALFRLLKSAHGERPWPEWDPALVHREPAALEKAGSDNAADLELLKVIQFLFHVQWRDLKAHALARGVTLFGDMPIYIALDSADAWANREMLQVDADGRPSHVAGVPPDYFSEDGQLWGNPLYDWQYHDENGYAWWIARMRHAATQADMVRVDHFRGFEAYWAVPAGEPTARNGSWVPGPGDRIFDAMREALGHLPIIAEDLGVITPEVEGLRDRHAIPGMVVLQFEVGDENFRLDDMREHCVCYTGTHDNDTTLGWFRGSPGDIRPRAEIEATQARVLAATGGSAATVHRDLVEMALGSNAQLAIAPLQDYLGLGSEARFNTPGKPADNWRWRVRSEQLDEDFGDELRAMTRAGRRGT